MKILSKKTQTLEWAALSQKLPRHETAFHCLRSVAGAHCPGAVVLQCVWQIGCGALLCCLPFWAFYLYIMCLCDFCVCCCCCCLAQEDILDLQLQRNLDYLDQQVRGETRSVVCHFILHIVSQSVLTQCSFPFFPITVSFPVFVLSFQRMLACKLHLKHYYQLILTQIQYCSSHPVT